MQAIRRSQIGEMQWIRSTSSCYSRCGKMRRASTAQLARLVGRSRTSVQSRIERLEKAGGHRRLRVRLAPEHGLGAVRAHVMIKVGPRRRER